MADLSEITDASEEPTESTEDFMSNHFEVTDENGQTTTMSKKKYVWLHWEKKKGHNDRLKRVQSSSNSESKKKKHLTRQLRSNLKIQVE